MLLGALTTVLSPRASAQGAHCSSLYEAAQTLRQSSQLLQAREAALTCASGACPKALAKDCVAWLGELEPAIPRAVFEARDEQGNVMIDVRVSVDGKVVAQRLDGRAIELNPGQHKFRFERADGAVAEVATVIIEGEKSRRIAATFPKRESPKPSRLRVAPIVWGGVSLAGFGVGTAFGVSALREKSDLDAQRCRPFCEPERGVSLSNRAAIADIGFALGLVAAVAAVSLYLAP